MIKYYNINMLQHITHCCTIRRHMIRRRLFLRISTYVNGVRNINIKIKNLIISGHSSILSNNINYTQMHAISPIINDYHFNLICKNGHIDVLKLMKNSMLKDINIGTSYSIIEAIKHNRLDIIKWVYENTNIVLKPNVLKTAIEYGHLHILSYLCFEYPKKTFIDIEFTVIRFYAVKYNQQHIIEWIENNENNIIERKRFHNLLRPTPLYCK